MTPSSQVTTDAILSLDEDVNLNVDEVRETRRRSSFSQFCDENTLVALV